MNVLTPSTQAVTTPVGLGLDTDQIMLQILERPDPHVDILCVRRHAIWRMVPCSLAYAHLTTQPCRALTFKALTSDIPQSEYVGLSELAQ